MPLPERVLIDTSAFYALVSVSDTFHVEADGAYQALIDREQELWTTSYVLVETAALIHHRLGFEPVRVLVESIAGVVRVFWVESNIHNSAWRELVVRRGAGLGLVDWTTVLAARTLRSHVFTFDRGFVQEGIAVVPRHDIP